MNPPDDPVQRGGRLPAWSRRPTEDGGASEAGEAGRSRVTVSRTVSNPDLPTELRTLDTRLQLARPSLLAELRETPTAEHVIDIIERHASDEHGDGRYRILRRIDVGGMGEVLAVADEDLGRTEAMKILKAHLVDRPEAVRRFLEEARTTARLEHPHIVPVHDIGITAEGTLFFTMKEVEGESLDDIIGRLYENDPEYRARWTEPLLLRTFLKLLDAVAFAHSTGVVHRDIKPANVMLGRFGEVYLLDWGLAKVTGRRLSADDLPPMESALPPEGPRDASSCDNGVDPSKSSEGHPIPPDPMAGMTRLGSVLGTPYYMSPEQASGDIAAIDGRSDIFSLGATLYELLALERPIDAEQSTEIIDKASRGDFVPILRRRPDLHPDLVAVIERAMAPFKQDRYPNAQAFTADLEAYLDGRAVSARRLTLLERLGRAYARHRRSVDLAVAAVLLAVLAAAGGAWALRRSQAAEAEGLLVTVRAALVAGMADLDGLRVALERVARAEQLGGESTELRRVREQLIRALRDAERREEQRIARTSEQERAWRLAAEARQLQESGDLHAAAERYAASLSAVEDEVVREERDAVVSALAAARLREQQEVAAHHAARADELLAAIEAGDPLAAAQEAKLDRVRDLLTLAGAEGFGPPGLESIASRLALQRRTMAAAQAQAVAEAAHAEALAEARAAAESGDHDRSYAAATRALAHLPGEVEADALRLMALEGRRQAAAQATAAAALAGRREQASEALAEARRAQAAARAAAAEAEAAAAEAAELAERLFEADIDDKQDLWQAHGRLRASRVRAAEEGAQVEAAAERVLALLRDQPEDDLAVAARDLLVGVWRRRLQAATAAGDLAAAAAHRGIIQRLDPNAVASGPGRLHLNGASLVTIRTLESGPDTRLIAGRQVAVAEADARGRIALELPAGRYHIRAGDIDLPVLLPAGGERQLRLPTALPRIPGLELAWVDDPAGGAGFLLGVDVVTHEQYWHFIHDPQVFPAVARSWELVQQVAEGAGPSLQHVPRAAAGIPLWQPRFDERGRLLRFSLPQRLEGQPVVGVDRRDAEAFCAWLSRRSGVSVRLPLAAERRRAADAGDPERLWPWGPVFDPAFTVTAQRRLREPLAVGTVAADRGPYGHRDLAGNVREWLADSGSVLGAMVAGGAWSDERPEAFRSDAAEGVPADLVNAAIGFRVLVELVQ